MKIGETKTVTIKSKERERKITFTTEESGAFAYGNRTAVIVHWEGKEEWEDELFDTRYFCGSLDDFIQQYYDDNINENYRLIW